VSDLGLAPQAVVHLLDVAREALAQHGAPALHGGREQLVLGCERLGADAHGAQLLQRVQAAPSTQRLQLCEQEALGGAAGPEVRTVRELQVRLAREGRLLRHHHGHQACFVAEPVDEDLRHERAARQHALDALGCHELALRQLEDVASPVHHTQRAVGVPAPHVARVQPATSVHQLARPRRLAEVAQALAGACKERQLAPKHTPHQLKKQLDIQTT